LHLSQWFTVLIDYHTEKQLLEMISYQLQILKPENIPKPPYNLGKLPVPAPPLQKAPDNSQNHTSSSSPTPSANVQKSKGSGGKHKSTHSHQTHTKGDGVDLQSHAPKPSKRRAPIPPDPHPPLSSRLSAYSPVVASGVLIDTVKAGINAQAEAASTGAGASTTPSKGKRKIVRVRQ
jgi:signal recognition particle subunit SRP19